MQYSKKYRCLVAVLEEDDESISYFEKICVLSWLSEFFVILIICANAKHLQFSKYTM